MSAQQILENKDLIDELSFNLLREIKECMEEYAELYAKRCLEIAAENVRMAGIYEDYNHWIVKESITEIKLPEHI